MTICRAVNVHWRPLSFPLVCLRSHIVATGRLTRLLALAVRIARFAMDPQGCFDGRLMSDCPIRCSTRVSSFSSFFFLSTEFEIALEPCQLLYRLFSVDFNWQLGWKKNARVYDEKYIALGSSSIILLVIHGSVLGALKEINGLCKFAFTFL